MKAINKWVLCQDMINAVRKSKTGKSGEWEGGWELFYTRCSGKAYLKSVPGNTSAFL